MTARVALARDESGNPPVFSQMMTFDFVWCFFFQYGKCRGDNQQLSLVPTFSPLHPFAPPFPLVCVCAFFSISPALLSPPFSFFCVLAYLLLSLFRSLCLLPSCRPLALPCLTLSGTYLWITNDNGLCSLMWEFCNQPHCMTYALMALIFSDVTAPQDHQQW